MAYTQKRFPNDESEFPTPPLWLVWNSDIDYTNAVRVGHWEYQGASTKETGQIRHQPTLEKAKKNVHLRGDRGDKSFWCDWAIYRWENDRYVLKYAGRQGDMTKSHPLWTKGAAKDGTQGQPRDLLDDEINEALASIASAAKG